MIDERCPVFVAVFAARIQAERAADELRAEGYGEEDLGMIWRGTEGPCGSGALGTASGRGVAVLLAELGVGAEASAYYQREVTAGLCLLLVGGGAGLGHALTAIGRHCGSIRVPEVGENM
jgi:hypothetical protein